MNAAIRVQGLSKQYRIGAARDSYATLRDAVAGAIRAPFDRLRSRSRTNGNLIWALNDVSFDVAAGEVVGVIGRNGAGKSTLLKILSRITEPTKGRVELYGRVGSLLEVGTGFHPELTGRENVLLNGAILGMPQSEIKRKFDEILAFAELEKFVDTPVKRYSSGMYVRLAFAVAAHLNPEILLVDEVLAVGDVAFQNKCLGKMDSIASEGRTILFVSHNLAAIKGLCHRAILLDHGAIEKEGEVTAVLQRYMGGDESASKRVWPEDQRPGNQSIRVCSMRLLNGSEETSAINISEELTVEVCYEVVEEGAAVAFSLILFDSFGACVFSSLSNTEKQFYGKRLKRGSYRTVCRVPGDLLNSGTYSLSLFGFAANWTDQFIVERALSFQAVDDGVLRGDYYGGFGGFVRPKLSWETEFAR